MLGKVTKLPPLNSLRCFEAAARLKNFSKAADELHVTQSAISHQIKLLEDWFAVKLFLRHGRETLPTAQGAELANSLTSAFLIIADSCKRAEDLAKDRGLTIAVLPSIATIWLIPRLQDFSSQHPDIPLRIVYAFHGRRSDTHDHEVTISWGVRGQNDRDTVPFLPGATVAVANPSLITRLPPHIQPADLQDAPLLHDMDRTGWALYLAQFGISSSVANSGPIFEDFNLLRAAALAGHGLALCPRALIADDVLAGRLNIIFPAHEVLQDHFYWVSEPEPTDRPNQQSVIAFKTWLIETAKREAPVLT